MHKCWISQVFVTSHCIFELQLTWNDCDFTTFNDRKHTSWLYCIMVSQNSLMLPINQNISGKCVSKAKQKYKTIIDSVRGSVKKFWFPAEDAVDDDLWLDRNNRHLFSTKDMEHNSQGVTSTRQQPWQEYYNTVIVRECLKQCTYHNHNKAGKYMAHRRATHTNKILVWV